MTLTDADFSPINFGISTAEKYGHEFIFQRPFAYDHERLAQDKCCLIIDGKHQWVEEFDDALEKANAFLANKAKGA